MIIFLIISKYRIVLSYLVAIQEKYYKMKISVKYFAMMRDITDKKQDILDFNKETSIQTMLSILCSMYGENFKKNIFNSDGFLGKELILLLNGEVINQEAFGSKMLLDKDVIVIMPPVGGG